MAIIVTLNSYLDRLAEGESSKPKEDRRPIPSISELARIVQIDRTGLGRIANNQVGCINHKVLSLVISELRRRGFNTQLGDIMSYIED